MPGYPGAVGRSFLLALSLVVLIGCPPEAADDDDAVTPPEEAEPPWTLEGTVLEYSGVPVAGVELAVGAEFQTTGADGAFSFEVPAGPPVQLDRTEDDGAVDSVVSCSHDERLWVWTGGSSSVESALVRVLLPGHADVDGLSLILLFEYADGGWLSTWSMDGSALTETVDGWMVEREIPPVARWLLVAAQPTSEGVSWAWHQPGGSLADGDVAEVSITLEPSEAGEQEWDGQLSEDVASAELLERIEVWGTGLWLPVGTLTAGSPTSLPVYDGSLDVLEYQVTFTLESELCSSLTATTYVDPLFPGEELSLPPAPAAGEVWLEDSAAARPTVGWSAGEDVGNQYIWYYRWDEAGEFQPTWSFDTSGDCGRSAVWPEAMGDVPSGTTTSIYFTAYGDGWNSRCRSDYVTD